MALVGEMRYLTIGENTYSLPVGGGGTVTSVGVANATDGGLTISGSPITSSGSISVGHSNVLSSAQSASGIYPIKIDKNGHITEYGSAVSIPTTAADINAASSTHTHGNITNGGDITATAPTITNGDQIIINDNSASKITNGPTFDGTTVTKALTPKGTWEAFLQSYTEADPIFSASASAGITSSDITSWNGKIDTAGTGLSKSGTTLNHSNSVTAQTTSAVYPIKIDAQGHISEYGSAVTIPSITLNGSSTTSPSFYAPTTVGTSGYVLKSNGSGAPTWTSATLTDTLVTQTNATPSSYTYWRPLIIGSSSNSTEGFTPSTTTDSTYTFNTLEVQPSSGTIRLGGISMYNGSYTAKFTPATLTANRTITVPDATGTVALTSDIPTVNDATLTIQKNGTNVGTFTANASSNVTANITVPTQPSDIGAQADLGFDGTTTTKFLSKKGTWEDVSSGGDAKNVWYGYCSTGSSTSTKVVTTTTGDFELEDGNIIFVHFSAYNTVDHPSLNVDGTGAISASLNDEDFKLDDKWTSGAIVAFVYDGDDSEFYFLNGTLASTDKFGLVRLTNQISSSSVYSNYAATPAAVKQAYDLAYAKTQVQIIRW